jgi:hypothetical protein
MTPKFMSLASGSLICQIDPDFSPEQRRSIDIKLDFLCNIYVLWGGFLQLAPSDALELRNAIKHHMSSFHFEPDLLSG